MKTKASCFWPHTMTFMKRSVGAFFLRFRGCGTNGFRFQVKSSTVQTAVGFRKGRTAKSELSNTAVRVAQPSTSSQLSLFSRTSKIAAAKVSTNLRFN
jgi:hypothetical protein